HRHGLGRQVPRVRAGARGGCAGSRAGAVREGTRACVEPGLRGAGCTARTRDRSVGARALRARLDGGAIVVVARGGGLRRVGGLLGLIEPGSQLAQLSAGEARERVVLVGHLSSSGLVDTVTSGDGAGVAVGSGT